MKRWEIPFTVFTPEGSLKQLAEIKVRTVWPGGQSIYLADIEKRLGFNLTTDDARTWAKALIAAADALEAEQGKP